MSAYTRQTALCFAARDGNYPDLAGLLIARTSTGPRIEVRFFPVGNAAPCSLGAQGGQTPLMLAAHGGHTDCVKALLAHGAATEAQDEVLAGKEKEKERETAGAARLTGRVGSSSGRRCTTRCRRTTWTRRRRWLRAGAARKGATWWVCGAAGGWE